MGGQAVIPGSADKVVTAAREATEEMERRRRWSGRLALYLAAGQVTISQSAFSANEAHGGVGGKGGQGGAGGVGGIGGDNQPMNPGFNVGGFGGIVSGKGNGGAVAARWKRRQRRTRWKRGCRRRWGGSGRGW